MNQPIERPILFSGEMVRAILDGRKTQTRRVINPQPEVFPNGAYTWEMEGRKRRIPNGPRGVTGGSVEFISGTISRYCPYGRPGDLLYVRESWRVYLRKNCPFIQYKADEHEERITHDIYRDLQSRNRRITWRPSIHMPKWASRLTLRVTAVRVERVQDTSTPDLESEGFVSEYPGLFEHTDGNLYSENRLRFLGLWNKINAGRGYSWESNPFVWVVKFERVI